MSRDDSITLADLIGKLNVLRVECATCGRAGSYSVDQLFVTLGPDTKVARCLHILTADCPRKNRPGLADACEADCPDLLVGHRNEGSSGRFAR